MSLEEIPVEVLISYAKLDEDSVKVLTPKDDGTIEYTVLHYSDNFDEILIKE